MGAEEVGNGAVTCPGLRVQELISPAEDENGEELRIVHVFGDPFRGHLNLITSAGGRVSKDKRGGKGEGIILVIA